MIDQKMNLTDILSYLISNKLVLSNHLAKKFWLVFSQSRIDVVSSRGHVYILKVHRHLFPFAKTHEEGKTVNMPSIAIVDDVDITMKSLLAHAPM